MQSLVDSLAEQRKRHLQRVEQMQIKDIKELVTTHLIDPSIEKGQLCASQENRRRADEGNKDQEIMDWQWQCQ